MGSAVIESMSENLIDFKLSPMMSFAIFGVTGAIAFRAINTLDGMVGFKTKEHINTGWFSANLDNVVNLYSNTVDGFAYDCCRSNSCEWILGTLGEWRAEITKKRPVAIMVGPWQQ